MLQCGVSAIAELLVNWSSNWIPCCRRAVCCLHYLHSG